MKVQFKESLDGARVSVTLSPVDAYEAASSRLAAKIHLTRDEVDRAFTMGDKLEVEVRITREGQ